ncbi:hypothetical protein F1188_00010 [Roseospira marina]|uniref:Protein mom n=1 Tax=Roseospira marina TaxID=140057 RepID=A0A5M6IIW9_9PROT|nr:hypothetical protein F1188_00010 [Roseospira marina]
MRRPTSETPDYIRGSNGVWGFGCRNFYVAAIPRADACRMVIANHYSRRIVNNSYVHLGVFLDGQRVGVLQFGYSMNAMHAGKVVANTGPTEHLELNRMWLDDAAPRNSESRALSYAMKYLKRACPSVRWVQSFADERCGRLGVVYQAANFLFLGSHLTAFYTLDGETYHSMLLTAHRKAGQRGEYLRANLNRAERHRLRQFRYVFFLKPSARRDLRMRPRPYPKPPGDGATAPAPPPASGR